MKIARNILYTAIPFSFMAMISTGSLINGLYTFMYLSVFALIVYLIFLVKLLSVKKNMEITEIVGLINECNIAVIHTNLISPRSRGGISIGHPTDVNYNYINVSLNENESIKILVSLNSNNEFKYSKDYNGFIKFNDESYPLGKTVVLEVTKFNDEYFIEKELYLELMS